MQGNCRYYNSDELIQKMEMQNLKFNKKKRAKSILKRINYNSLKSCRNLIFDNENKKYKDGTDFEDLYRIYTFDKDLKSIIFRNILDIEMSIKTAINDILSPKYGIEDINYLKIDNFDLQNPHTEENLKKIIDQKEYYISKNRMVNDFYERNKFIPFWLLSRVITMSSIKKLFSILKPNDKRDIVTKFKFSKNLNKKVKKFQTMLSLLVDVRNMCAHDETIITFEHKRIDIGILPIHQELDLIKTENGQIISGKKDFLAILIAIKYLIDNKHIYEKMINQIYKRMKQLVNNVNKIGMDKLCDFLKLPFDFYIKLKM